MDIKNIFKKDDAVSPVIGVVLMVAITVILAAAIGSSVFGQGTSESAPQANINVQFSNYTSTIPYNITIEHLGGDSLTWSQSSLYLYASNGSSLTVDDDDLTGYFNVGEVASLYINGTTVVPNSLYNVKIVDTVSGQMICDKDLRT